MVCFPRLDSQKKTDKWVRQSSEAPATAATDSIKSFIAGGFGGVSAVLVGMFKLPNLLHRCITDKNTIVQVILST